MILNYTYRLYPDAKQIEQLDKWLETCRVSYNYALRELKDWISSRKSPIDRCSLESEYIMAADYPFPSYHYQQNVLPKAKKQFPRLKSVPSQVLQTNIRRLHDAWDFFQKRGYGVDLPVDRDVAAAQELCNRGIETYRGTPEKQEIGSQVEVSGNFVLDNWRRGAMPNREFGKPAS